MNVLDIKGLHLEVVPFKKNNIELYRMCFNCEVSIIVDKEKLDEIDGILFIEALDRQMRGGIDSMSSIGMIKNDVDKTMSDFIILVDADEENIEINVRTCAKLNHTLIDHIYTISKSDNKEINKFRKKLGDWI